MDYQNLIAWGGFLAFVLVMLAIDLFVLHRKEHEINLKEALIGVLIPVSVALAFIAFIYWSYETHFLNRGIIPDFVPDAAQGFWPTNGRSAAMMYLMGYIVEISLSADNVFLFVILMNVFAVPSAYQHRVLFWGVLGALVMRAVMILTGEALIIKFSWIIYVFGGFLVITGIKMLFSGDSEGNPADNIAVRLTRKIFPVTKEYHGQSFFVRLPNGTAAGDQKSGGTALRRYATPLFLALVCIEFTDLVFAVDSIPAIFGITQDAFIVFTSNVFAILGLRSLYFLLAGVMDKFHFLKVGLSIVLTFVGVKMLLPALGAWLDHSQDIERNLRWLFEFDRKGHHHWHLKISLSLGFIVVTLAASILGSLIFPKKNKLERDPRDNK